ncbi:hypothetical protein ACFSKU_21740 [Pontibacter silvestris]|uniref:Uncharacterized protein n=1 Tax=Pontibacter silvestris TaxID=2305183 RepID=A0ABW4X3G2_9BACT|nr:hypothetical protein [Pontibacter silvestris]MCC9138329.1 hypothetical protein [Pontibacter silvestris]
MKDQTGNEIAIFHQVCEVNELDPQVITKEAQERFPDKFKEDKNAERLIWTALDHRAKALIDSISADISGEVKGEGEEYTIDGDPAAPSFMIHDEYIHNKYSEEEAAKLIDVLGQVQLPITA